MGTSGSGTGYVSTATSSTWYATLAEIRQRLDRGRVYTATTISFASGTKTISDTRYGLRRFKTNDVILVAGSTSNDGVYNVTTGNVAGSIVTTESLTTEAAGDTVTITAITDPVDDAILESLLEAVSRAIDMYTGTRFYTTASDETRYYTADDSQEFMCPDDILTVTTLATDGDNDLTWADTWTATDYMLWPFNASLDSKPYWAIKITPTGDYTFPTTDKGVKIVGTFGYSVTAPVMVKEACLLVTEQVFKRKDAIFGMVGTVGGEQLMQMVSDVLRRDPHVKMMLAPFVRWTMGR